MPLSRFCQSRPPKPGRTIARADQIETIRDRIANVEAVLRSYKAQATGDKPTQLKPATLADNIARCTARVAELRQQLAALL